MIHLPGTLEPTKHTKHTKGTGWKPEWLFLPFLILFQILILITPGIWRIRMRID